MSIEGHKRLVQVIPDQVHEWWDKWELRGLILVSLVSQIILTLLGDRTKYKPNNWTRPLLWSAYLLADWVVAVAMGVISSNVGDYYNKGEQLKNVNPLLLAFWASFFLMHLGGPDTITAHALEDNELWLRYFVGLLSQTALTVYIIILSWKGNLLSHLTIPMLIIGIIKYGERTWSLYCASIKHLRNSFLRSIDSSRMSEQLQDTKNWPYLQPIYIFVSLFVDLVLSPSIITLDRQQFQAQKFLTWLGLDIDLNLMYNVFYTKAFANYGFRGFISRLITLIATIIVLVLYATLSEKKEHLVVDHIITYLLLVGALIGEIYALILVVFSQWTIFHFEKKCLSMSKLYILQARILFRKYIDKISLGQSNFFNLICDKKLKIKGNFFPLNKLEELPSASHCIISDDLEYVIFQRLCDESKEGTQSNPSGAPRYRNLILGKNVPIFAGELEFHRTIITWHIATELFYHSDEEMRLIDFDQMKNCKEMSDYMFYLLVKQRHMLPVGAGLITLHDTVTEVVRVFEQIKVVPRQDNLAETYWILLQHGTATTRDDEVINIIKFAYVAISS